MKRKNVNKSQSTNDLYSQLVQAKDKKKVFLKQLKNNINSSQSLIKKNQSEAAIRLEQKLKQHSLKPSDNRSKTFQKLLKKKQKSLQQLTHNLNDRIIIDREAIKKLSQLTQEQAQKKQILEKRMEEIKRRNQHRIKQLQQFQNKYLKKLNDDYKKDKQKQERLLIQYEQVLERQGRIKQTQNYRKAIDNQDWHAIVKEKNKLEKMIKQYRKKQQILIRDQNPEVIKKIIQQNQVKNVIQEKQVVQEVRKPRVKIDAKEIGNQYLQYAKKLKQLPKEKPKVKLLDVNLKSIDYQGDIMNKIARNTGDLSKIRKEPLLSTTTKQTKVSKEPAIKSNSQLLEIKEDEQTKKFLKQIRTNLKQLDKTT